MDLSNHYPACLLKSLFYKRLIINRNLIYASSAYHAYILERVNHAVNCCGAYAAVFFGCLIINLLTAVAIAVKYNINQYQPLVCYPASIVF